VTIDPATTAEDVRAWLVGLFLSLPNAPVYAATRREVEFIDSNRSPSAFDWPALASEILGPRSRERLWLMTFARCEARRVALARGLPNPPGGGSVSEFCREFGVHRGTFERTVRRSLERLAAEWDHRRAKGGGNEDWSQKAS
jgi:hypothetical protein